MAKACPRQPWDFVGFRVHPAGLAPAAKTQRRMVLRLRLAAERGPEALERTVRAYQGLLLPNGC